MIRGPQRRAHPGQDTDRPHIDVLQEFAADRDQQTPQGEIVGDVGGAHGAEQDAVTGGHLIEPIVGHHGPVGPVVLRSPFPVPPVDGEVVVGGDGVDAADRGGRDFLPDPVSGDDVDVVGSTHGCAPWLVTGV